MARFQVPPGWPPPPPGWTPPPEWQPDPSWPPAPPGWRFWVVDPAPATPSPAVPPPPPPAPAGPAPTVPAPPPQVPTPPPFVPNPVAAPPTLVIGAPATVPWYRRRLWQVVAGVAAVLLVASALSSSGEKQTPAASAPDIAPVVESSAPLESSPPTALPPNRSAPALLAALPVKGRAPRTGYSRDRYGQAWADVDRNGCDTRNDTLRRDLRAIVASACVVLSGVLESPYTGRSVRFVRGGGGVDIDHVVSLSDSWQKGAQQWSSRKRLAFANDPLNLLAVESSVNQAKSDSDTASWLPPLKSYRCAFVARQVAVKAKFKLWVTAPERVAMGRILSGCPQQIAPTGDAPTEATFDAPVVRATPRTVAPPPPPPPAEAGTDPRFGTCREAKANGYGPYYRGRDLEYDWYRDADSDGIVCE
ncbi:MAG TPA: DUF1524 domain-containing protein [Acidimicrobiales bacterium]|nr:DUF1524 domain-containing protein [Acidimicrobiales bacterium]